MIALVLVVGLFGLLIGSFLNVVVHRVPAGQSIVRPRSRCTQCGTEIRSRDNVPVISWLLLRGRCRACGGTISARYPAVELLTGALFALAAVRFGADAALPAFLTLFAALVALSAIDLERFLLPNRILYPGWALVAALLVVAAGVDGDWGPLRNAAIGGAVAWSIFFLIHFVSPRGMGFGDVRLAGLVGTALGWLSFGHVFLGLFLGFLFSVVVTLPLLATGRRGRKDRIPFGPFLALGAVAAVLVGQPVLDWYLG